MKYYWLSGVIVFFVFAILSDGVANPDLATLKDIYQREVSIIYLIVSAFCGLAYVIIDKR